MKAWDITNVSHSKISNIFYKHVKELIVFKWKKFNLNVQNLSFFSFFFIWRGGWLYLLVYNNLCKQCLSPLMLWVPISIRARCTTLCDEVCQWLATGQWFSPGPPVSSTNKTDRHNIAEILLKLALNTIKQTNKLYLLKGRVGLSKN
jgi:hypothetical protein